MFIVAVLSTAGLAGCGPAGNNQDAIRRHTADVTAAAARDAKSVALGVVDGLRRKTPVNINTATKEQLVTLPGISGKIADGIIADRPYARTADVLQRHLVTKAEYDAIADRIVAN